MIFRIVDQKYNELTFDDANYNDYEIIVYTNGKKLYFLKKIRLESSELFRENLTPGFSWVSPFIDDEIRKVFDKKSKAVYYIKDGEEFDDILCFETLWEFRKWLNEEYGWWI